MSNSEIDQEFEMRNPTPEHFQGIQDLCKKVYPFSKPWSIKQLESHHSYFPDGQLIVLERQTNKIVGLAFSLIISWDDYLRQDNWRDFTSAGFFHNHNPKKGKTLYGAEVMVDPEYRGRGIGKLLYRGRQEIVRKYHLKRIRAGARLKGYCKFQDQLSPVEYTKQVVLKNIYDPTLSFQLSQGFVVLDVTKNYLFNDPESLGYAAVIEWLNPEVATKKDFMQQKYGVEAFFSNQHIPIEYLPRELRRLVRKITLSLGQIIKESEGTDFYERIDHYRQQLKKGRSNKSSKLLLSLMKELETETKQDRFKIAHAFALLLELINVCETAYRTWRLQHKSIITPQSARMDLNFVLTAHPTEARSRQVLNILSSMTYVVIEGLQNNFAFDEHKLFNYLRLLWIQPLVKIKAPSVIGEAEYIYHLIFTDPLFDFIVSSKPSYNLKLRTWVGGDKDGHPGVNQTVMRRCLEGSRKHIVEIIENKLLLLISDLKLIAEIDPPQTREINSVSGLLKSVRKLLAVKHGDGRRVKRWRIDYFSFLKQASTFTNKHPEILLISRIFEIFPALVLPIELRESAHQIAHALKDKNAAISRMLSELNSISGGCEITHYAGGLVISHCESEADMVTALSVIELYTGSKMLPLIPLFESHDSLTSARRILSLWFQNEKNLKRVMKHWQGKFEVMLGYSDSSKQIGALPSRYLIRNSMFEIEKVLKKHHLKPVFFHGSGGSVARGGGSLKEQIAWWSHSAIATPKLTVQGEMIQRLFATKEILNSQCLHFTNEARLEHIRKIKMETSSALSEFVNSVQNSYTQLISDSEFLNFLLEATPYEYLEVLRIGSRPTTRSTSITLSSLRAIPWVLCWTQTRLLWPTWWGIGTAWKLLSQQQKTELKDLYLRDPFLSSFVKTLGFTLAKVELHIWERYLHERHGDNIVNTLQAFKAEYEMAKKFVFEISQEKQLIWYRPWLEESIKLRSAYIHILNLLQIMSMRENDERLLKETLVGIACGMLTTG